MYVIINILITLLLRAVLAYPFYCIKRKPSNIQHFKIHKKTKYKWQVRKTRNEIKTINYINWAGISWAIFCKGRYSGNSNVINISKTAFDMIIGLFIRYV